MAVTELAPSPKQQIQFGQSALRELKALVQRRSDKLVINGKQYLYFTDYQMLGAFFGITTFVKETKEITEEKHKYEDGPSFIEVIGYKATAVALRDGEEISCAEAVCLKEESNWSKKPQFQLLSMAQTRACAKALRNVLSWIVKLPDATSNGDQIFQEETAEEIPGNLL